MRGSKFVVVGDRLTERDQLANALARRGHTARVASTFELRFATALEQPDFVLLDVGTLSLEQVLRLVADDALGFHVIACTDRPSTDLAAHVGEGGLFGYFCKPDTADGIVQELDRIEQSVGAPSDPPDSPAASRPSLRPRTPAPPVEPARASPWPSGRPSAPPGRFGTAPPGRLDTGRPPRLGSAPPVEREPAPPPRVSYASFPRPAVLGSVPPPPTDDYVTLARGSTRSEFVEVCPFPFLISHESASMVSSRRRRPRTAAVLDPEVMRAVVQAEQAMRASLTAHRRLAVFAIRPTRDASQRWISVGRANDSDIVIDHATMSNVHAHFLPVEGRVALADAGSKNGTWVGGQLLERHGAASGLIASGDMVRFGELEFTYLASHAAWDVLRVNAR